MGSHNPFDADYSADDSVSLDGAFVNNNNRDNWLKMTKGQTLRASFVYFHPVDLNAVSKVREEYSRKGEKAPEDVMRLAARKALESRAASLSKTVDTLTQVDRLDLSEVRFKLCHASFQQGLGFVINRKGKDGPEADMVWNKLPEPKAYYSSLLLIYPTDRAGNIEKDRLTTDWKLMPWRFGNRVYEDLWKLNAGLKDNGMNLATQDLRLECKDQQYQNIAVSFVGPAIWQKSDKFKQMVLNPAIPMYERLIPFREMTTDQLRAKLGLGGSAVSDVAVPGSDFADVLDGV